MKLMPVYVLTLNVLVDRQVGVLWQDVSFVAEMTRDRLVADCIVVVARDHRVDVRSTSPVAAWQDSRIGVNA